MRRIATLAAVVATLMVLPAVPAGADQPEEFSFSFTIGAVDPCTGEDITVDQTFDVKLHRHNHNNVFIIDRSGVTSNGYVGNGHETSVTNKNHSITVFNNQVVNDETGARYTIQGRFKIDLDTGDAQWETIELRCTNSPQ